MDNLTRAQRDARAKLHSCFLFLQEQRLQPLMRSERLFSITAVQQQREDVQGRPLPVRALATVSSAVPSASSGTGGLAGGA